MTNDKGEEELFIQPILVPRTPQRFYFRFMAPIDVADVDLNDESRVNSIYQDVYGEVGANRLPSRKARDRSIQRVVASTFVRERDVPAGAHVRHAFFVIEIRESVGNWDSVSSALESARLTSSLLASKPRASSGRFSTIMSTSDALALLMKSTTILELMGEVNRHRPVVSLATTRLSLKPWRAHRAQNFVCTSRGARHRARRSIAG